MKKLISLADCQARAAEIGKHLAETTDPRFRNLYGVPRGGLTPAYMVAANLNTHHAGGARVVSDPVDADIFIDDVIDSGATRTKFEELSPDKPFFALFDKTPEGGDTGWLVFPWEQIEGGEDDSAEDIIVRLLQFIGEDPNREGLLETPKRVMKAWAEWTSGYGQDPAAILKTFEDGAESVDEMVIVHNIPVVSKCEHHLADIQGIAHIGYIPNGRIVGLSKLPRLLDVFQRRLQVQERLTNQVAETLNEVLEPQGVGVIIRASHACMNSRGIKIHGSVTTTSAMRGKLFSDPAARSEFLALCRDAEAHQ